MSGFTQEDFDENIAKKMRLIQAGQEYVADCDRLGMKTVDKFLAIAKSNAGSNHHNEDAWKATTHLSTVTLRAARGSPYGSSASLSQMSRSFSRASSGSDCAPYRGQRMADLPLPPDDSPPPPAIQLYGVTEALAEVTKQLKANTEQQQEMMKKVDATAEQQEQMMTRLEKLESKRK